MLLARALTFPLRFGKFFLEPRSLCRRGRKLDLGLPLTLRQPRRDLGHLRCMLLARALTFPLRFGKFFLEPCSLCRCRGKLDLGLPLTFRQPRGSLSHL